MHRSLEHDVSCLSRTENGSPPSRIGVGPEGVHAHRSPNGARGSFARSLTPPARKTELRVRAHFLATLSDSRSQRVLVLHRRHPENSAHQIARSPYAAGSRPPPASFSRALISSHNRLMLSTVSAAPGIANTAARSQEIVASLSSIAAKARSRCQLTVVAESLSMITAPSPATR